jgi:hypothetical protein
MVSEIGEIILATDSNLCPSFDTKNSTSFGNNIQALESCKNLAPIDVSSVDLPKSITASKS